MYEHPGKLCNFKYECEGQVLKYLRVHPEILKFLTWSGRVSFVVILNFVKKKIYIKIKIQSGQTIREYIGVASCAWMRRKTDSLGAIRD